MHWNAPVITATVFKAFRAGDTRATQLKSNLRRAFDRMMNFYGFEIDVDGTDLAAPLKLKWTDNATARFKVWVRPKNHNHLRLTRIIRCLRVLGLDSEAQTLYTALEDLVTTDVGQVISPGSRTYWERAASRPLHQPPHESEWEPVSDADRVTFLKDFEEQQSRKDFLKTFNEKWSKTLEAKDAAAEEDESPNSKEPEESDASAI